MKGFLLPWIIGICLMILSTAASAAIYRCDINGKPTYSDHVCGKHAKQVRLDDSRHPVSVVHMKTATIPPSSGLSASADTTRQAQDDCPIDSLDSIQLRNLRVSGDIMVCESADAVRDTWGKPDSITRTVSKGHVREHWVYRNARGKSMRTVNLEDGKVTSFQT